MRALGLDLGSKRIGVAVSDRSGTIATPLTVLQRSGSRRVDHARIAALVLEEEADLLVVGLPLSLSGAAGPAARSAVTEVKQLATVVGVPIETFDERFTTVTADRVLIAANLSAQARRRVVDKLAAAVMLQTFLDRRAADDAAAAGAAAVTDPTWVHDPWDDAERSEAAVVEQLRRARGPLKWAAYTVGCLLVVGLLVLGAVGFWYVRHVNPSGDPGDPINFTVVEGDTLSAVAHRLEDEDLVSRAWLFEWYTSGTADSIVPGYYRAAPADHMGNLLAVLRTPPEQTYTAVTFPEGFTLAQMATRVERDVPLQEASDFLAVTSSGEIRSPFQPAEITSLEGMLFPDTYQVAGNEGEGQLVERMITLMERVGRQEDLEAKAAQFGYTPYQILVIASMIEREAKVPQDRPLIARVIYNRLQLGMALQIDATLLYGQDPDTPFSELRELDTPYNTYLHTGLPPTPIANPGRASIQAALNPAPNPDPNSDVCIFLPVDVPCLWLYYVLADEDGSHAFAVTFEQHEANIAKARADGVL